MAVKRCLPRPPLPREAPMATCRGPLEALMTALFVTLHLAISIVWWIIILSAIFSWLYAFNVVNPRNQFVNSVGTALCRLTEPVYRPIRRILPDLGGVDISPIIVLLLLTFFEIFMHTSIEPLFGVVH